MSIRRLNSFLPVLPTMFFMFSVGDVLANETVIQQEKMSFERCLNVITVSEKRLSVAPKILPISDKKRAAIFYLIDGQLKILCDGEEGEILVSTIKN